MAHDQPFRGRAELHRLAFRADGRWGGRFFQDDNIKTPRTGVGCMTLESLEPDLWLPSGGDNGYEGFVYHDGLLWTSYYSSHEGNPAVYLAKIRIKERP